MNTMRLNMKPLLPMDVAMATGHCTAPRRLHTADATSARFGGRVAGERGAAIVEFAIVSVVLFTIIFSLIEGGLVVRAHNAVNSSADEAARRGAIAGNAESADWQILQQLRVRGTLSAAQINYVVVYRAADSTAKPSADCKAGIPVSGECNVYERADFELPSGAFVCTDTALDGSWCPTTRAADSAAFEYIGVWINATHVGVTGWLNDVKLGAQSVLPLEGSGGI